MFVGIILLLLLLHHAQKCYTKKTSAQKLTGIYFNNKPNDSSLDSLFWGINCCLEQEPAKSTKFLIIEKWAY